MPIDPATASVISGYLGLAGNTGNALSTVWTNRRQRQLTRELYGTARKHNLEFWNMQNAYNHPKAQFQRMLDSGLNPKLMYEKGSPGIAGPIQNPELTPPDQRVPEFGSGLIAAGGALTSFYDIEVKQAQANLLDKQAKLVNENAAIAAIEHKFQDRNYWNRLQGEEAKTDKTLAEIKTMLNRDIREEVMHSKNITEATQRLKNLIAQENLSKQQLANLEESFKAIQLDNQLRQIRIDSGDIKFVKLGQMIYEFMVRSVYKIPGTGFDARPGQSPNIKR